jgi:hypothetical protein
MIDLAAFITRVIDDGIAAAIEDYGAQTDKGRGALAGFELCRDKTPEQLPGALAEARALQAAAFEQESPSYWFWACRAAEIEWVVNCVSAVLSSSGYPPLIPPTVRGARKAAEILGAGGRPN